LSEDRALKAIYHEEPDKVPIFEPYGVMPPTSDVVLGRKCVAGSEIRAVDIFVKKGISMYRRVIRRDWFDLIRKLKFDGGPVTIGTHYRPDSPPKKINEFSWFVGDSLFRYDPRTGVTLEVDSSIKRGGIQAFKEYIKALEEETDEEIDDAIVEFQLDVEMARMLKKLGVLLFASAGTVPVGVSWFPLFLKSFYTHPNLVRRYLRQRTRRVIRLGRIAADLGVKLMFIGGDIAYNRGPMISPSQYREFILPEIKAQTGALHRYGIFAFNSSDGNLWPIIHDYLISSGVDGMMEIQTTAGMDLKRLKEDFGDEICFVGSVDCQFTLVYGTISQVEEETRNVIRTLSPGGGHILSSSNSIHSGVKPENFFAMLRTARKFGKYNKRV